jgi:hypothetical protein
MQFALMKRGLALLPTLARIGPGSVHTQRNGRDELSMVPVLFEQAQALTTLGDRPLAVLTASDNLATEGWSAAQDRLATLSSDSIHPVVESSHAGMVSSPTGSDASAAAITAVTDAVRSDSPLAAS